MRACRVCLSEKHVVNMKTEIIQDRSIYSVFLEFCGLEIPDCDSPMICSKCKEFLNKFRSMKRMVLTNSVLFMKTLVKTEESPQTLMDDEIEFHVDLEMVPVDNLDDPDTDQLMSEIKEVKMEEMHEEYVDYLDEALTEEHIESEQVTSTTSKNPVQPKQQIKTVLNASNADKTSAHWCSYCFQRFPTKVEYVKHRNAELAANGGMECDLCGFKQIKRNRFMGHIRRVHLVDRNIRFSCDICGQTFSQKGQIIGHKRVQHFNFRYICHICSRPLKSKTRLDMHIRHFHEKQRPVVCTECGKGFSTKSQLKVHITQIHTNLKPFSCSFCDKTFSSNANKIVHEKLHSNERYPCEQCDYTTNTIQNLKRHMIRHQDVYKYTCATCGQQFKCSGSLKMHQYTHKENNFECEQCHKKFSRPQNLKIHIEAIHLQKRYNCPKCNEEFSTMNCVKKHVKIQHDGVRYFCQCGKYFDRKTRYTKHGEVCHLAAVNEPDMRSIYLDQVYRAPPGRPAKYKTTGVESVEDVEANE